MGNSLVFDNDLISSLARKLVQARRLYGSDSAYVIGLFRGVEWLLESVEDGENAKQSLHHRVLEQETGKPVMSSGETPTESSEALPENSWIKGIVKWFNNDKGYGFISTEENIDVFVHWRDISAWDRSISQGEEVEFMVTKTAKGFQAINVMKTSREGDPETGEGTEPHEIDKETETVGSDPGREDPEISAPPAELEREDTPAVSEDESETDSGEENPGQSM